MEQGHDNFEILNGCYNKVKLTTIYTDVLEDTVNWNDKFYGKIL